jgi:hypothetical protein
MRRLLLSLAVVASVEASQTGLAAHHAITAVYDPNQPVTLDGVVTSFHYVNPHPFVEMQAAAANGQPEPWRLEFDNLRELAAVGMSAETFKVGERLLVTGSRARDRSRTAYVRRLQRSADGFLYEQIGSSPRVSRTR